jgi:beta-galactosidase
VPYEPGTLTAKAYDGNKLIVIDSVSSTGNPAKIRLRTDRVKLSDNGEDVTMIMVDILDSEGRVVPTASNLIKFSITGPAHIDGVGNGDPSDHEPDKASQRMAFNGHCLAVVQSNEGQTGDCVFTASSDGLQSESLNMSVTK